MASKLPLEFLKGKRDFSPLLVHLTKDVEDYGISAKDILAEILTRKILLAANHYCLFDTDLERPENSLIKEKFSCITPDNSHYLLFVGLTLKHKLLVHRMPEHNLFLQSIRQKYLVHIVPDVSLPSRILNFGSGYSLAVLEWIGTTDIL